MVVVTRPGEHAGAEADAAVTATPGCTLSIQVADCAPIALLAEGALGVVHAGWRGLLAGVVDRAVAALRDLGAVDIRAAVGPCIHAECYEFGAAELDRVAAALGDDVRRVDGRGVRALDVPAAVRSALRTAGVTEVVEDPTCTACSPAHWSFRAAGDTARQAVVTWM